MNEEFEKLELSDSEQNQMDLSTSDYAQVVFHDIAECYPFDAGVECKYTVTATLSPSNRDWVGLYKVGWTSSKEHIYYEWAPLPDISPFTQFDSKIIFAAKNLPGDDGEFYQFCYVTSSGQVRGASTPFQFRRPTGDEFVEVEDFDDDIMVIKSKTNALEDELGSVLKEKETLVKNKDRLETERESLLNKLIDTEKTLIDEKSEQEKFKKQLKAAKEKIDQLNSEAKDMLTLQDGLRDKIARLSEEKMTMTKLQEEKDAYSRSLREKVKCLINEKDSFMGKNKMLEEEKDLYKSHFTSSETTLQGHIKEIDNLGKQLKKEEQHSAELLENIIELQKEIETLKSELADQQRQNTDLKDCIQGLEEQVKSGEEKLLALEECKHSLGRELETLNLAYKEVSSKWQEAKEETHYLKDKVVVLDKLNEQNTKEMIQQIDDLNARIELKEEENTQLKEESQKIQTRLNEMSLNKKQEEEGPLFALQTAHECMKGRLQKLEHDKREMEKDMVELVRNKNKWESRELEMKREIEDLKERLLMGQEEYKQKYIECKKVYQELKKSQRKSSLNESDCSSQTSVMKLRDSLTKKDVIEKEIPTQTPIVQGAENQTQTCNKGEEQTTQTSVAEVETHTQTPVVHGAEQHTQTSVEGKHSLTQTEQQQQDIADLTSPELQMQLDELGKELECRTAKKQKYKEQYQREKEKNSYIQRHYFEELEKKDQQIQELETTVKEKENRVQFLEQYIEAKNRQMVQGHPDQRPACIAETVPSTQKSDTDKVNKEEVIPTKGTATTSVVEELDPLNSNSNKPTETCVFNEEMLLPPPLEPDRTPTSKMTNILSFMNGQRSVNKTVEIPVDERIERDGDVIIPGHPAPLQQQQCCTGITFPLHLIPEQCKPEKEELAGDVYPPQSLPSFTSSREAEDNEERFFDAPETEEIPEPQPRANDIPEARECPICEMRFPPDTSDEVLQTHVEHHFTHTKDCPVCDKKFSSNTDPRIFEEHVQKHFECNPDGTGV